jgi:hypothetical protein
VGAAGGTLRLVDVETGAISHTFRPLDSGPVHYKGAIEVARGDFNGDGIADVAVAAADALGVNGLGASKAGKVFVYDGAALDAGTLSLLHTFTPFAHHSGPDGDTGPYTNGLKIAVGDVNGDDHIDLVAGTRGGNGTTTGRVEIGRLAVVDGTSPTGVNTLIGSVVAPFGEGYQKGILVAVGNADGIGGEEIAVTRGPVASPSLAVQRVKVKVYQLQGDTLQALPLAADGSTAFAPFATVSGPANAITRDSRVAFVDANGDGKAELVFSALDPLTNPANVQVRIGVYSIDVHATQGAATIVSTPGAAIVRVGTASGTYLTGTAVKDHAIAPVAGTGSSQNLALVTQSGSSGIVNIAPLTGATQSGGGSLGVASGGVSLGGTDTGYVSPYTITGVDTASIEDALNTAQTNTTPSQSDWYDPGAYKNSVDQGYGPTPSLLPPISGVATTQTLAAQYIERVLAVEQSLVGTIYQHHHDTLWNPYANGFTNDPTDSNYWPWSPVNIGEGTAGIDCTDLTALAYNVGAGIFLNSGTDEQALADQSTDGQGNYAGTSPPHWNDASQTPITPQFILGPNFAATTNPVHNFITLANAAGSLDSVTSQLQPGDLLYIVNDPGPTAPTQTPTGTSTQGSTTLTLDAAPGNSVKGSTVSGPGIVPGTTVTAEQGATLTLSEAAGLNAGMGTFTLTPPTHAVSHAVIWLGSYGTLANGDPSPVPLVISSHDNSPPIADANGVVPPPGIHILPFQAGNWFYDNFVFAMRVLPTVQ